MRTDINVIGKEGRGEESDGIRGRELEIIRYGLLRRNGGKSNIITNHGREKYGIGTNGTRVKGGSNNGLCHQGYKNNGTCIKLFCDKVSCKDGASRHGRNANEIGINGRGSTC